MTAFTYPVRILEKVTKCEHIIIIIILRTACRAQEFARQADILVRTTGPVAIHSSACAQRTWLFHPPRPTDIIDLNNNRGRRKPFSLSKLHDLDIFEHDKV